MQSQNSRTRKIYRHNTDSDELVINRFERMDFIYKVNCCRFRDELLLPDNKEEYLRTYPKSQRKYRYHSVIKVSVEHITSFEQNFKFLKNMKKKSDMNSDLLLADCLEVYNTIGEGPQKDAVYDLIGLVIQLKNTSVPHLRELECEKIFRRIQNLVTVVNFTKRERLTSIEYQYREENEVEPKIKASKMTNRIKFLLARFEFIIATLGHFIHYNKIANTLQKKVHSRALNSKPQNTVFSSIFTSMETKPKKEMSESNKNKNSKNDIKSASRKESLDGPVIAERIQSYREDIDEALTESKFQQVKAYFKWKLEKWKDQDLEEIVLVCRICSKSMYAKIMKKHSPYCKKVAEEERSQKEFSKKFSNLIHQVTKEKHNIGVELLIEKKQLTSLRAAQLENSREIYQQQSECSSESSEESPVITRAQTGITASFLESPDSPTHDQFGAKAIDLRHEFKAFMNTNCVNGERIQPSNRMNHKIPLLFVSAEKEEESPVEKEESLENNSPPAYLLLDRLRVPSNESRQASKNSKNTPVRSRSQSRIAEDDKERDSGNPSLERIKKEEKNDSDSENKQKDEDISTRKIPLIGLTKVKSSVQNKKFPGLEVTTKKADLLEVDYSPKYTQPSSSLFPLKRSHTSQIFLGSPLLSVSRRSSKKGGDMGDSFQKRVNDAQTLSALRERLEKIKVFQNLIKGYDTILHYAKTIDTFNEFSSEARVIFEEGRTEVECILEKVKNNTKFEEQSKDFRRILSDKLEYIKAIDVAKKELKLLEIANIETSESNKEESGTNPTIQEVKSSLDSFEMMSSPEISPSLGIRKSISVSKTMVSEFDKRLKQMTPDDSPIMKRSRKLRSKSVGKATNNLRYEVFEKNLQKVIKKLKKEKIEGVPNSPGKTRSKFYRNSVFTPFFEEDPLEEAGSDKSPTHERNDSRRESKLSKMSSIKETNTRKNSSESEICSDSQESQKSDSYKEEDLHNDLDLNTQITEKACFSDDESNLRRCAKKQEDGFSSLITINDFEFIKLISKGAYGRVWLVKRKITGDHYAMKIINFADRKNMNQIDSLRTEKKVFEKLKGDFVVKAVFTFVHNSYLCIVMEFMIGGDFGHILEKLGALEEDDARFYIAEMVLALDNLHQLDIVHRDLKPDNILLNKNGHIKLTDFGLSEVGVQKHTKINKAAKRNSIFNSLTAKTTATLDRRLSLIVPTTSTLNKKAQDKPAPAILSDEFSTIPEVDEEATESLAPRNGNRVIGTPDYMAPEVINGTCYDDPCIDWWSVGVILFEFIVGIPPFNDPDVDVVFENIVKRKIPWDELQIGYDDGCITPEAKDLIDRLLESDRAKRLGAKGTQEIKCHPFFSKTNWEEILKSKAPIIPVTENDIDVSNFEKENKKYLQSELENPFFHEKTHEGTHSVSINKENFELARVDILHEENEKVVQEATNTISQEELEKMRKARLVNRKWSVFD